MKNKVIIVLLILVVAIGAFIIYKNGFNLDYGYTATRNVNIQFKESFNIEDIKTIAKDVLGNEEFNINYIDDFEAGVVIQTKSITDEQVETLEAKLREKYTKFAKNEENEENEHTHDDILQIVDMPYVRIYDVVEAYIIPMIISGVIVIIALAIVFRKLGIIKAIRNFINFHIRNKCCLYIYSCNT